MVGWIIFGILAFFAVCWLAIGIGRTVEAFRGHSRCKACGSALKGVGAAYASTCAHCGRDQPWARRARAA